MYHYIMKLWKTINDKKCKDIADEEMTEISAWISSDTERADDEPNSTQEKHIKPEEGFKALATYVCTRLYVSTM